jgi:hypothetical protein
MSLSGGLQPRLYVVLWYGGTTGMVVVIPPSMVGVHESFCSAVCRNYQQHRGRWNSQIFCYVLLLLHLNVRVCERSVLRQADSRRPATHVGVWWYGRYGTIPYHSMFLWNWFPGPLCCLQIHFDHTRHGKL